MGTCCKITQNDQSVCIAVDFVFSSGQTKMPCWAKPPLTFFFLACVGRPICTCLNKLEEQLCNPGLSMLALCDLKICSGKSQPLFSQNIRLFLWLWGPRRIYNQPSLHSDPREKKKKQEFGERKRERERERETTYADVFQTWNMLHAKRHLLNCRCVFSFPQI